MTPEQQKELQDRLNLARTLESRIQDLNRALTILNDKNVAFFTLYFDDPNKVSLSYCLRSFSISNDFLKKEVNLGADLVQKLKELIDDRLYEVEQEYEKL